MDWARVLPIVCEFGVGAILCGLGLWSGWRSGFLDPKLPDDRRMIGWIVGGYLGLLAFYCAFTFWLPFVPREAAP
ncbi:MAG: hypothetical protein AMXMBFR84_02580 [Candidatus Hydrogenedentota bacterium]